MEVKWIKIVTDIFDDEKILLIETLPAADSIITIWFKLLCLCGKQNNSGVLMFNGHIAYTDEMLAVIFRRELPTVRLALKTFQDFGMIEIIDGVITIPNWDKHQNIDALEKQREDTRLRVQRFREKQKLIASGAGNADSNADSNVTSNVTVTLRNATDKNREDKSREDKNREGDNTPTRHKYGEYQNVLLSDQDLEKLKKEFPSDWQQRIENLSGYIAQFGKTYKSHLATIRNWARKDREKAKSELQQPQRKGNYFVPSAKPIGSNDDWNNPNLQTDMDDDDDLPF